MTGLTDAAAGGPKPHLVLTEAACVIEMYADRPETDMVLVGTHTDVGDPRWQ